MQLGFIGLGRMGKAMVLHLLETGMDVVVFNRTKEKVDELAQEFNNLTMQQFNNEKAKLGKFYKANELSDLIDQVDHPRVIWIMVEHGKPVDEVIESLIASGLDKGDIIIDGGNSFYKDSVRRNKYLKEKGIHFLDIGTSGGLEGAREGACLMIGGDKSIYNEVQPLFRAIAGEKGGYSYFGPAGAGHFVKMVHNGVEYGMLQAIGEGFEILEKGPYKLDFHQVSQNWNRGSVVRGWLMELLERAFQDDPQLENIEGIIGGGTTGRWTKETAKELEVSVPAIDAALNAREKSKIKPTFAGKIIAALRNQFGQHAVVEKTNKI